MFLLQTFSWSGEAHPDWQGQRNIGCLTKYFTATPRLMWFKKPTHWKRPWFWERLKAGGEGDNRGWDGWMPSLTQWTWVWVNSGSWRWTGRPGVLQSMGLQRVRHDWVTELNWTELNWIFHSDWDWMHGNGHEFEQTLRNSKGQGRLVCCSSWGHKESHTT